MNSLYRNADVVVESWVELRESVTTTYEVDREDQFATLYFGTRNAFVLHVNRGCHKAVNRPEIRPSRLDNWPAFQDMVSPPSRATPAKESPAPKPTGIA